VGGVADNSNRKRQETSKGKRAHARHKVTARVCVCVFVCVRARLRFGSCQFLALITGKENTYFERSFEALGVTDLQRQVCSVCSVHFSLSLCMCVRVCICVYIYVRICVNMYICIQEGTTPNDPATTGFQNLMRRFLPLSLPLSLSSPPPFSLSLSLSLPICLARASARAPTLPLVLSHAELCVYSAAKSVCYTQMLAVLIVYVCLICMPYMYALYVCLVCTVRRRVYATRRCWQCS